MSYKLIISGKAKYEIEEAYFYYEYAQKGLGDKFITHLDNYLERISTSPWQFPEKRSPYREAFVRKFPFLIIFEIQNNNIVIYSVFNTSQDPQKKPGW